MLRTEPDADACGGAPRSAPSTGRARASQRTPLRAPRSSARAPRRLGPSRGAALETAGRLGGVPPPTRGGADTQAFGGQNAGQAREYNDWGKLESARGRKPTAVKFHATVKTKPFTYRHTEDGEPITVRASWPASPEKDARGRLFKPIFDALNVGDLARHLRINFPRGPKSITAASVGLTNNVMQDILKSTRS